MTRVVAAAALGAGALGAGAPDLVPLDPVLLDRVRRRLTAAGAPPTAARVAEALREEGGALRGDAELLQVLRLLQSEIAGAGPLEPLLADEAVTDILVNAPDDVWVDRGAGLERVAVRFPDDAAVRRLAQRLAAPTGRRLDDAQPWVDARLAGGVRLHAVLPPVAPAGTCLSLRVPRRRVFSLPELVEGGALPADGARLLGRLIASRTAFLVTGGTPPRWEPVTPTPPLVAVRPSGYPGAASARTRRTSWG